MLTQNKVQGTQIGTTYLRCLALHIHFKVLSVCFVFLMITTRYYCTSVPTSRWAFCCTVHVGP